MNSLPLPNIRRILAALVVTLALVQTSRADVKEGEATHVRFLIVVDTHDSAGATWGLDGKNLKAVLEAGLKKQKLDGTFTIETFTGNEVTGTNVLGHYNNLKVGPNEALVFYYSGHGAQHPVKGHFMQFTHGPLFRKDLLAAMQKHNPRLMVLLTDCCANYAGGGPVGPGTPPPVIQPGRLPDGVADIPDTNLPPRRPKVPGSAKFQAGGIRPGGEKQAPPGGGSGPIGSGPAGNGVILKTGDGPLPLKTVIDQTDGEIMRHLFYRHTGLVDINGCEKGKSSHGTIPWGGSLFTIGFLSLQMDKVAKYDANQNGLVEWTEFFPYLQTSCDNAGKAVSKGQIRQIPDAIQLGQPVLTVK